MRLIISSLSSHNLHLLFCCVLSIFALTLLVRMPLFYVALRRYSVSLISLLLLFYSLRVFTPWEILLLESLADGLLLEFERHQGHIYISCTISSRSSSSLSLNKTYTVFALIYCIRLICYSYLPNPSARAGYDTRSIF